LVEQLICNQKVAGSIPAVGTNDSFPILCRWDHVMLKPVLFILLATMATGILAQTGDAPLSLEVAQQRARFARDQMTIAEDKVKAAQAKEKAAQKRVDEARADAEKAAKNVQDAQADLGKARAKHDQAYQELKRSHDATQQQPNKPQ
jgi:hypothetical protein